MARKGENIHKRNDGRWEGRFISNRLPNGKAVYSSVYAKSYLDVKKRLAHEKALSEKKNRIHVKNILFSDAVEMWLNTAAPTLKSSTIIKYRDLINMHILPELGNRYMLELDANVLNKFIDKKLQSGRLDGKGGLSNAYVRSISIIIKSVCDFAVGKGYGFALSDDFNIPKNHKRKMHVIYKEEQAALEKYLFSNINNTTVGIILALYTGMRVGEICALKWENVDLKRRIVYVKYTVSKAESSGKVKYIISKPKTDCSVREIPIPDTIMNILETAEMKARFEYVVSDNANFVCPRTYENRFHKTLKECDIRNFNFHMLRHTFATRCIDSGVDIKTLSEILGHANAATTLNLYVHPSMEQKKRQINKLSKMIA